MALILSSNSTSTADAAKNSQTTTVANESEASFMKRSAVEQFFMENNIIQPKKPEKSANTANGFGFYST